MFVSNINLHTHPVMHFQLRGSCQSDGPPLFGALRSVDGKRVFAVIQHRDQDGHFVDEGMKILKEWRGEKAETKKEELTVD